MRGASANGERARTPRLSDGHDACVLIRPARGALPDPCGATRHRNLTTVPGLETPEADPGVARWDCDRENLTTGASVELGYDRNGGGLERDAGNPMRTRVAAHIAADRADCQMRGPAPPGKRGHPVGELLIVKVDQALPVAGLCSTGPHRSLISVQRFR